MNWSAIVGWILANAGVAVSNISGLVKLVEELLGLIHQVPVPIANSVRSAVENAITLHNDPEKVCQALEAGICALKPKP